MLIVSRERRQASKEEEDHLTLHLTHVTKEKEMGNSFRACSKLNAFIHKHSSTPPSTIPNNRRIVPSGESLVSTEDVLKETYISLVCFGC
jgi:hypothetical protein